VGAEGCVVGEWREVVQGEEEGGEEGGKEGLGGYHRARGWWASSEARAGSERL